MSRQFSISLTRNVDWVYDTVLARAGQSQTFALKGFSWWGIEMGVGGLLRGTGWSLGGSGDQRKVNKKEVCSGGADVDRFCRQATWEWFRGQRRCKM